VALLSVLGFLALRVHAEETVSLDEPLPPEPTVMPVRDQIQHNTAARQELFKAQRQEREQTREETRSQLQKLHASGTMQEAGAAMQQARTERFNMLTAQRQERSNLRTQNRDELKQTLESRREEMQQKIEARRAQMQQHREERRTRLAQAVQDRLGKYITRTADRMDAALDRLAQIADRIGERVDTFEANGADLTDARAALQDAYGLIDVARSDVSELKDVATQVLASETPKELSGDIRDAAKLAKDSIIAVHGALKDAVVAIKAAVSQRDGSTDEGDATDQGTGIDDTNAATTEQ